MEAQENKETKEQLRVKQDQLQEVNLGEDQEDKNAKISAKLEGEFKEQLIKLL